MLLISKYLKFYLEEEEVNISVYRCRLNFVDSLIFNSFNNLKYSKRSVSIDSFELK